MSKGLISFKFTEKDKPMELYCRKTITNLKKELMTETGRFDIALKHILYELCQRNNNGYGIDIEIPKDASPKEQEIVDFYELPEQKERIANMIEQKHLCVSEQQELMTLALSFNPSFDLINSNDVKEALKIYYLKTNSEPMEIEPKSEEYLESYYCGECKEIHFNRGVNYLEHLIFKTEYIPEIIDGEPYMCTECNHVHKKGKIYEEHKQYAEVTEVLING